MAACDAGQVEQGVGDGCTCQDTPEPRLLHRDVHCFLEEMNNSQKTMIAVMVGKMSELNKRKGRVGGLP